MNATNTPDPADTHPASEDELRELLDALLLRHGCGSRHLRNDLQSLIRTEQKKLLAAVMERVIGKDDIQVMDSDEVMDTKFCSTCGLIDTEEYEFECTCQRKNELRAEQRAVLQQIMKELDHE